MSAANLDSADLKGVDFGGLIREDVMNKIWDISKIPLPFTDLIGSGSAKNEYKEWTTDELAAPDVDNSIIDGSDATGNDTKTGAREVTIIRSLIRLLKSLIVQMLLILLVVRKNLVTR